MKGNKVRVTLCVGRHTLDRPDRHVDARDRRRWRRTTGVGGNDVLLVYNRA
jgi:hypothetical protein